MRCEKKSNTPFQSLFVEKNLLKHAEYLKAEKSLKKFGEYCDVFVFKKIDSSDSMEKFFLTAKKTIDSKEITKHKKTKTLDGEQLGRAGANAVAELAEIENSHSKTSFYESLQTIINIWKNLGGK